MQGNRYPTIVPMGFLNQCLLPNKTIILNNTLPTTIRGNTVHHIEVAESIALGCWGISFPSVGLLLRILRNVPLPEVNRQSRLPLKAHNTASDAASLQRNSSTEADQGVFELCTADEWECETCIYNQMLYEEVQFIYPRTVFETSSAVTRGCLPPTKNVTKISIFT